ASDLAPPAPASMPSGAAPLALARAAKAPAAVRSVARTASATAPAAVPEPTPQRPNLELIEGSAEQPQVARSAAERIADATGGAISQDGQSGLRSVTFPSPNPGGAPIPPTPQLSQQTEFTISRELAEPAPASTPAQQPQAAGGPAPAKTPETEQDEAHKREELYEYFLDRFKRDLLAEREQMGHLIIDNP
ncbi:hypothetical protein OJ997_35130, partial [Solirubrobacter phytolaccae]